MVASRLACWLSPAAKRIVGHVFLQGALPGISRGFGTYDSETKRLAKPEVARIKERRLAKIELIWGILVVAKTFGLTALFGTEMEVESLWSKN